MGWGKNEWITVAVEGIAEPGWFMSWLWISGIAVPWTHTSQKQEACKAHAVFPSLVKALVRLNLNAVSSFGHYTSGLSPNLSCLSWREEEDAVRSRDCSLWRVIENLAYLCDIRIRRRRGLEEIPAEKEELFSVPVVDELNLLCAIGHSLYTYHTSHIFGFVCLWFLFY